MSLGATAPGRRHSGRLGFLAVVLAYGLLIAVAIGSLLAADELSLGRNPLANLAKTAAEFARPSFLDVWFGEPRLEYRGDDGTLLRVEDRRVVEAGFLRQLAHATWITFVIGTLGSLLGALLALPLGVLTARNLGAPRPLALAAKALLDTCRAIHTLVFGLVLVGIVGLGPTAGILAIAAMSRVSMASAYSLP